MLPVKNWLNAYYRRSIAFYYDIFQSYWTAFGGRKELFRSPYVHLSFVLLIVTSHYWINEQWWEQPLSTIPNLLGFSLGGFAVFVGLSDEGFKAFLLASKNDRGISSFLSVSSIFAHFIIVQALSLILALIANSLCFKFAWPVSLAPIIRVAALIFAGIGYLFFLYAIASMLAATMSLFRVVTWYQMYSSTRSKNEDS
jgi:hypothetical protein